MKLKLRKAEHIRGTIHIPHLPVDLMDARIPGEQHVHLTGNRHALGGQGCADDLADQGAVAQAGSAGHIRRNGNIVPLGHHFRPFPLFLAIS